MRTRFLFCLHPAPARIHFRRQRALHISVTDAYRCGRSYVCVCPTQSVSPLLRKNQRGCSLGKRKHGCGIDTLDGLDGHGGLVAGRVRVLLHIRRICARMHAVAQVLGREVFMRETVVACTVHSRGRSMQGKRIANEACALGQQQRTDRKEEMKKEGVGWEERNTTFLSEFATTPM